MLILLIVVAAVAFELLLAVGVGRLLAGLAPAQSVPVTPLVPPTPMFDRFADAA